MHTKRKRNIFILLFILIIAIVATLFYLNRGSDEEKIELEEPDSTYIKLGVLPTMECLPYYVAEAYGISDSLGLHLKVVPFASSMDADTAFASKIADGIVSDMVKLSIFEGRGDSISGILGGDWDLSLITSRQSRISTVKGLKDKVIANTRHSILDMYTDLTMSSSPKDSILINTPQINSLSIRANMIRQNQIDGGILSEPYTSFCLSKGGRRISKSSDIESLSGMYVVIFNDSVLYRKESDIEKFIKVYNSSVDYINTYRDSLKSEFLSLLDIDIKIPDSIYTIPEYRHASVPSDVSLNKARAWCSSHKILGSKRKTNIVYTKPYEKYKK